MEMEMIPLRFLEMKIGHNASQIWRRFDAPRTVIQFINLNHSFNNHQKTTLIREILQHFLDYMYFDDPGVKETSMPTFLDNETIQWL